MLFGLFFGVFCCFWGILFEVSLIGVFAFLFSCCVPVIVGLGFVATLFLSWCCVEGGGGFLGGFFYVVLVFFFWWGVVVGFCSCFGFGFVVLGFVFASVYVFVLFWCNVSV